MTLNDLDRRNSPYFEFFTEFDCFAGQLSHSEIRKILTPSYSLPLLAITNLHCNAVSLRQLSYLSYVLQQFTCSTDRQTDGQTDRILMQRGKNFSKCYIVPMAQHGAR